MSLKVFDFKEKIYLTLTFLALDLGFSLYLFVFKPQMEHKENQSFLFPSKTVTLSDYDLEGDKVISRNLSAITKGEVKGEAYSYSGIVQAKYPNFLIIKTTSGQKVKINVEDQTKYYKTSSGGLPIFSSSFNDLNEGNNIEVTYLKETGGAKFLTYALIIK